MDLKTTKLLRGIALLMVVGSHYANWMFNECLHQQFREFVMTWGVYGVDIFFLVSGYGLVKSASKKGIDGDYVIRRFTGVYLPYLLIIVTCYIIDNSMLPKGNDLHRLLTGYDYWYMYVQFAFYIMFALCYMLPRFRSVILSTVVILFTYCLWAEGRNDFWMLSNMAFLIGVYLAEAENRWDGVLKKLSVRIALPLVGLLGTGVLTYIFIQKPVMVIEMLLSLFFTIAVAGIGINIRGFGVVICSLGTYSLYIYIMHTRLFWKFVMYNEDWTYFQRTLLAFVMTIIICIPLGFIMDTGINKIQNKIKMTGAKNEKTNS